MQLPGTTGGVHTDLVPSYLEIFTDLTDFVPFDQCPTPYSLASTAPNTHVSGTDLTELSIIDRYDQCSNGVQPVGNPRRSPCFRYRFTPFGQICSKYTDVPRRRAASQRSVHPMFQVPILTDCSLLDKLHRCLTVSSSVTSVSGAHVSGTGLTIIDRL